MNMSIDLIKELTNTSFLWGPFFFSILFILVITRTAHSYYAKVIERTSPPADEEEKKLYANYFKLSTACGILMVFLSVGWWIYHQLQRKNAFEGTIVGLETKNLEPELPQMFLRWYNSETSNGIKSHECRFVVVSDKFDEGQQFSLNYYPDTGAIGNKKPDPIPLIITYKGNTNNSYRLIQDKAGYQLIKLNNERNP